MMGKKKEGSRRKSLDMTMEFLFALVRCRFV